MSGATPPHDEDPEAEQGEAAAPAGLVRQVALWPPVRWALVIAVVLGLSSWTPHGVGLLFLVLLVPAAIGGTSRTGWRLIGAATRSPRFRVLVVGIAALAGFLLLVLQVLLRGPLTGEDVALSRAAARVPHDWVYLLAQLFAAAGHWAIQAAVLLVVTAVLWDRRRRISMLVIAGLSLGLLAVVVGAAKLAFGRAGPPLNVYALHAGGDSFPSGHTAAAVVVGCVLAWLLSEGSRAGVRRLLWVAAALWATLMGVSRLYLDVHWLTDVLAGWAVGVALVCAIYLSYRWFSRYDARIEHALQTALGPRFGASSPTPAATPSIAGDRGSAGDAIGAQDAAVDVPAAGRDIPDPPCRQRTVLGPVWRGRRRTPRPRWQRWMCRGAFGLVSLTGVCLLTFALLLAVTPSVGDAEARVQALDHVHGVTDPGGTIPTSFAQALVATEDSRFYSNNGLDVAGMLRAATAPLHGGQDQGGSTLDQQLAKQLYAQGNSSVSDKIEQVVLAVKLDDYHSKQQILEMYASTVYFGQGFYGLDAASCGYFGMQPAQLNQAQVSLLAGVLQAPSDYDPLTNLDLARSRQRHVLDRLVATHALTSAQADAVFAAPLGLRVTPPVTCR